MAYIESVHSSVSSAESSQESLRQMPEGNNATGGRSATPAASPPTSSTTPPYKNRETANAKSKTSPKPTSERHAHWDDTNSGAAPRSSSPTQDNTASSSTQAPEAPPTTAQTEKRASFRARARRFSSLSSASTNATADDLPGAGTSLGNLARWIGRKVDGVVKGTKEGLGRKTSKRHAKEVGEGEEGVRASV